jgi:hypothetical protein
MTFTSPRVTVDLQLHGVVRETDPSPVLRILVALASPTSLPPEGLRRVHQQEGTQLGIQLSNYLPAATIDALLATITKLRGDRQ